MRVTRAHHGVRISHQVRARILQRDIMLFAKTRTGKDGPEFDDAEAGMVIGRIERCTVIDVAREGINYRIEMKVPGARVVHVLRMPAKEMQDHERASTSVVTARRSIETRAFPRAERSPLRQAPRLPQRCARYCWTQRVIAGEDTPPIAVTSVYDPLGSDDGT